jgi:transposase-like protein
MERNPEIHEKRMICPYCNAQVIVETALEVIFAARRICEKCNREFLIVDDQPQKQSA